MDKLELEQCQRMLDIVARGAERLARQVGTLIGVIERNAPEPDKLRTLLVRVLSGDIRVNYGWDGRKQSRGYYWSLGHKSSGGVHYGEESYATALEAALAAGGEK